jgi:predicted Zn-dependent protease
MAPRSDQLLELAERALSGVRGDAQATAWWERQLTAAAGRSIVSQALSVEIAVVRDGRIGTAVTTEIGEGGLAVAAEAAARAAATGPGVVGELPEPGPGHAHDGYDAAIEGLEPADGLGEWDSWRAAAAKTAIASTRGVRAYEQRSFSELRVRRQGAPGRSLELAVTAVGPARLDAAALAEEAEALLGGGDPVAVEPGEYAVVLGPWAMAEVARRAGLAFGGPRSPLAERLGTRVAASAVNLSDSPRFAATLPRSYDAEGAPRQPMPLVQDGVAHRVVEAGTGHAVGPGGVGGTVPEHLVLVGGGAADVSELAAPVERGLFIPALSLHGGWVVGRRGSAMAEGVRVIRGGAPAEPVPNLTVLFEPLELLSQVQALGARQRTVPSPLQRSARTASGTVAPAGRAGGGLFVAGAP